MMELDGRPVTTDQLATLALLPYGHFTSMRVEGQRVRGLNLHLERLSNDCRALYGVELDLDKVRAYLRQALAEISGPIIARVTIFDPDLELTHPTVAIPHILITTRSAPLLPLPPLRLQSTEYLREDASIKHVGLYGSLRLRRLAQERSFDDILFVNYAGEVLEGATWNIGFFDGEQVVWPRGKILAGTTMRLLTEAHRKTTSVPVHLADLSKMVAAFATNTAIQVQPIVTIDDCNWPASHPIIKQLQDEYLQIPAEVV